MQETKVALETTSTWLKDKGRSNAGTTQRYIGIGLLGLGALSVGAGVLSFLDMRQTQNTIETTTVWGDEFDEMIELGESASQRGVLFSAAGGAALIGGAVLYWLGERASRKLDVDVELPSSKSDKTLLLLNGRF